MSTRSYAPNQGDYIFPPFVDIAGDTSPDSVTVLASNAVLSAKADVDRAEFLRAVETELNVKIINRADLPTPVPHPTNPDLAYVGTLTASRGRTAQPSDVLMARALDYIVAAEWSAAQPPVDQADVDALAQALYAATADPSDIDVPDVARRLIRAGVRPPKAD